MPSVELKIYQQLESGLSVLKVYIHSILKENKRLSDKIKDLHKQLETFISNTKED